MFIDSKSSGIPEDMGVLYAADGSILTTFPKYNANSQYKQKLGGYGSYSPSAGMFPDYQDSQSFSGSFDKLRNTNMAEVAENKAKSLGFTVKYVVPEFLMQLTGTRSTQMGYADGEKGILYINKNLNENARTYTIFHEIGHPFLGCGDSTFAEHSRVEDFAHAISHQEGNPAYLNWLQRFAVFGAKNGDRLSADMVSRYGYTPNNFENDSLVNLLFN